jgi:hypothetical protein
VETSDYAKPFMRRRVSADKPPRPPFKVRPADVLYVEEDIEDDIEVAGEKDVRNVESAPAAVFAVVGDDGALREIERLSRLLEQMDVDVRHLEATIHRQSRMVLDP